MIFNICIDRENKGPPTLFAYRVFELVLFTFIYFPDFPLYYFCEINYFVIAAAEELYAEASDFHRPWVLLRNSFEIFLSLRYRSASL